MIVSNKANFPLKSGYKGKNFSLNILLINAQTEQYQRSNSCPKTRPARYYDQERNARKPTKFVAR